MRINDDCTSYTLKNGKKTISIAERPLNNGEKRGAGSKWGKALTAGRDCYGIKLFYIILLGNKDKVGT
jgi:hypothetical protein